MDDLAWCAADPHLSIEDPALPVFLTWLQDFERAGARHLVLLGDLFQVWIGLPGAQTPEQESVLTALSRLAKNGRKVIYLAGNRDYFMEELARWSPIRVCDHWDLVTEGPARIRFEHGDLINTSDANYLRWREFSRARTVRRLFQLLPAEGQLRLARHLEGRLAGTNAAYKSYFPERELSVWARRLKAEGVNSAVLGHFHLNRVVRQEGVEIRFLPQFREEGVHLRVARDGAQTLRGVER
ncbi:MAG: UDP-2,3-diacylglucosamine diphosphatase [Acidobacteriota bacterium]